MIEPTTILLLPAPSRLCLFAFHSLTGFLIEPGGSHLTGIKTQSSSRLGRLLVAISPRSV